MNTMKAVRIHEYGEPDVLRYEDAPCPDPASDEVLVRVYAIGLNPVDWKTRAGSGMARRWQNPFPLILGWDISGVVETVGSAVTKFKVGDLVFGMARFPDVGSAYAEYVAVPEHDLAHKPENVSHLDAAAVPLAALTAWQGFFEHASLQAGQRLLVQGAAGGVGHLAVQIGKWKGAYVIGTASSRNTEFVKSLGVDEVVDYTQPDYEKRIAPVDFVLDTVAGEQQSRLFGVLKDGGTLVSIAGILPAPEGRNIHTAGMLVHTSTDHIAHIAQLMAENKLKVTIAEVFPLTEMPQAHQAVAQRTVRRGKIVVQVRE